MKLIIAEKPSVAAAYAAALGAKNKKDGYLEGNGCLVTWCIGHLVSLAEAGAYEERYKKWNYEDLPILPEVWQHVVSPGKEKQFSIVKSLMERPDVTELVNGCDAGREGELIFRLAVEMAGCTKPVWRLWISSMEDTAIREGFSHLEPGSRYEPLYHSALCRSKADWLIGINATRLFSVLYHKTLNVGRVQTPTLALVVERQKAIENFKPETYWEIRTNYREGLFSCLRGRFNKKEEAEALLEKITPLELEILSIERKKAMEHPPKLFDLTLLQVECNRKFAYTAENTLKIIQSLYEKKVLSYPRTGSRFISDDVFDEIPSRIALLEQYPAFSVYAATLKGTALNRRSVDAGKVTDHHALIITECLPGELPEDERKVYDMVAARLLESFSARCVKDVTTVRFTAGNSDFTTKGTVIKSAGWRAVHGEKDEDEEAAALPPLQPGETFPLQSAENVEKQTKPRPLHTESSLLSAMESCGRELQETELRDSLKDIGIGTPATRASIIETLFSRDYVRRDKKNLVPTGKGLAVYHTVKGKRIADVEMTGQWETALARIETGEMDAATFRKGIEVNTAQITEELLQVQVSVADGERIPCPKCQSGRILFYPKVAKCSNVDCSVTIFRNKSDKQLTDKQITELVTTGKTGLIKGFKSKNGKVFDASLAFDEQFNVTFVFPEKKGKPKK